MQDVIDFVHEKALVIMDYFHDICEKENIPYSLYAGTMLGEIRHKGFIPWDDDLDIVMLRADYERFMAVLPKYHRADICRSRVLGYKWIQKLTYSEDVIFNGKKVDIFVDIFILDKLPKTEREKTKQQFTLKKYQGMILRANPFSKKRSLKKRLQILVTNIMGRLSSDKKTLEKYDKVSRKHEKTDADVFFTSNDTYKALSQEWEKEWTESTIDVDFAGRQYKMYPHYHELLTMLYGDYMTPPPESERVGWHHSEWEKHEKRKKDKKIRTREPLNKKGENK